MYQYWHGLDVNVTARMPSGLTVQGGTSTGRGRARQSAKSSPSCRSCSSCLRRRASAAPRAGSRFESCHVTEPWLTQIRGLAAYVIPKVDVQVSTSFQFKPGTLGIDGNASATNGQSIQAVYNVPTAVAAQSLGRPLSGAQANTA
jgi:hypothetical protein